MRVLEDSIVRLLKQKPFYGQFILQCRRQSLGGTAPTGVTLNNGIPTLAVNRDHFRLFSPEEQQALLEHLVKHLLHLHPCRRRQRHERTWNLACDLAVNGSIENLPPESPRPARFKLMDNLSAEEYYAQLPQLPLLGSQAGQGDDRGEGQATEHQQQPTDNHDIWHNADKTPLPLAGQVVRQMVQTSLKKCHQEIPAELETLLRPFLGTTQIPWQQILRQFVGNTGRIGRHSTWKRQHRRFSQSPGIRKRARLNLLVAVDVSDSTDQQKLRETFAEELLQIARGRASFLTVLYTGSQIQKIATFDKVPEIVNVYRGGGYTDLCPAFEYARQMVPLPTAIIYLTDGFGPAPEQSFFPTLWVLTPDGKKPADWGIELRLHNRKA